MNEFHTEIGLNSFDASAITQMRVLWDHRSSRSTISDSMLRIRGKQQIASNKTPAA